MGRHFRANVLFVTHLRTESTLPECFLQRPFRRRKRCQELHRQTPCPHAPGAQAACGCPRVELTPCTLTSECVPRHPYPIALHTFSACQVMVQHVPPCGHRPGRQPLVFELTPCTLTSECVARHPLPNCTQFWPARWWCSMCLHAATDLAASLGFLS